MTEEAELAAPNEAQDILDRTVRDEVERRFTRQGFARDLGIRMAGYGQGWCETEMQITEHHLQHTGLVHAGVQTTIADHTAGAAASTLLQGGEYVVSVEFKMNLLRPGRAEMVACRAQVLKPGRRFSIVESEVYACSGGKRQLISKMTVTMAVMQKGTAE